MAAIAGCIPERSHTLSARKSINNEFSVFVSPSPHCQIRVNESADMVVDINPAQATGNANEVNEQIGMARLDKILHQIQHLFTCRWSPGVDWTLIECIHEKKNCNFSTSSSEAVHQCNLTGLFGAIMACDVHWHLIENFQAASVLLHLTDAMSGFVTKLTEKGRQQTMDISLRGILDAKIVIWDQCRRGLSHALDIFDNGWADSQYQSSHHKIR
jgi:hypothetical protein